MDLQKFAQLRDNLYHLTDKENLNAILETRRLNSTATLAQIGKVADIDKFLRTRRIGHCRIERGKFKAVLRDQDPLFRNIVIKNLEAGWTFEDFVFSLNARVFFWATAKDLENHYKRYEKQGEFPKIIRIATSDLFAANRHQPQFCRLNSGAPRCSSYHAKGAPPRGPRTFLEANGYEGTPSSVREITFLEGCMLPITIYVASHPHSHYRKV